MIMHEGSKSGSLSGRPLRALVAPVHHQVKVTLPPSSCERFHVPHPGDTALLYTVLLVWSKFSGSVVLLFVYLFGGRH